MTICIYTHLLVVPLFTDEGSRRLPKCLICSDLLVINLASVCGKSIMSLPSHSGLYGMY